MAAQISLEVISKDGNDNISRKTYTDINPAATYSQLDAFGRALINLSTNTYSDSIKVERTSCNEELG